MGASITVHFTASVACQAEGHAPSQRNKLELAGTTRGTSATTQLEVPAEASVETVHALLEAKLQPTLTDAESMLKSALDAPRNTRVWCSSQVVLDPLWVSRYQRR